MQRGQPLPSAHLAELAAFSMSFRRTLEQICGDAVLNRSWQVAQLSLRDPAKHAAAAYLASLSQSQGLCRLINQNFDVLDFEGGLQPAVFKGMLQNSVLEAASVNLRGPVSQKVLSGLIGVAKWTARCSRWF